MIEISQILSFLVRPRDESEESPIQGTDVPLSGSLYSMLENVFAKAESECNIPIRFLPAGDGSQHNDARSELIEVLRAPTLDSALALGQRLQGSTGRVSGLGLLFLILGRTPASQKIVLSRFPANEGVLAEATGEKLEVEFVEKIFMKSSASYKAAVYSGQSLSGDFWTGRVVDRQLSNAPNSVANYWVRGFLMSDFRTTSKAGSRLLGLAVRKAAQDAPSVDTKHEIVALATLIPGLSGQAISPNTLFDRFSISEPAARLVRRRLPNERVASDIFEIDVNEFQKHVAFRVIELDSKGILTAPSEDFDTAFQQETIDEKEGVVRFVATGKVVDERVRTRKS